MARITLTREEYTNGELPPVCVVCGEFAAEHHRTEFDTCPLTVVLWALSLPWACTLIIPMAVVGLMMASRNFVTQLPICESHRDYFLHRRLLALALAFSTWAYALLAWGIGSGFLLIGAGVGWLMVPVLLVVFTYLQVRGKRGIDTDLILIGAHPDFVAAVEDARSTKPRGDAEGG